jgi:hypothetical protein
MRAYRAREKAGFTVFPVDYRREAQMIASLSSRGGWSASQMKFYDDRICSHSHIFFSFDY